MRQLKAIILAAGEGSRMKSKKPKVLHEILNKSMVDYVIETAKGCGAEDVCVVVGHKAEEVKAGIRAEGISFALQAEQKGTGHAVMMAGDFIDESSDMLILYGDTPLITGETLTKLVEVHRTEGHSVTVVSSKIEDPTGYGRIMRDDHGGFERIVEHKDATDTQRMINNTKVIPARLYGKKRTTGGKVEMLLLTPKGNDVWEVLVNPGKKALPGTEIEFSDSCYCKVLDKTDFGGRVVEFHYDGNFDSLLDQLGEMPTPPYIHKKLENKDEYQTVYAKYKGSAAAPTAGLHFTPELMEEMKKKGAELLFVTLHVGIGTFRPVNEENIEDHEMHKEWYTVSQETADAVNQARSEGRRIIAVGTTSVRTLESAGQSGTLQSGSGWTQLYIYPGYQWHMVDAIVTNFHLPESTLIMMMASFAGREHILAAYEEAVKQKYRFFSFGDAMFIR